MRTMVAKAGVAVVMAAFLAGCGATPVGAPERPSEQRVTGKKAPAKAAAAGKKAAVGVAAAEAAAAVAVLEAPAADVQAVTTRDASGKLLGADFTPEGGRLAWQLRAPEAGLLVSKVKIVFQGAGDPVTVEATPAELEMGPELRAETRLVVPFALIEILGVIGAAPQNADVRATATFYDAQGRAIHGVNGKALALSATIDVAEAEAASEK